MSCNYKLELLVAFRIANDLFVDRFGQGKCSFSGSLRSERSKEFKCCLKRVTSGQEVFPKISLKAAPTISSLMWCLQAIQAIWCSRSCCRRTQEPAQFPVFEEVVSNAQAMIRLTTWGKDCLYLRHSGWRFQQWGHRSECLRFPLCLLFELSPTWFS